MAMDNTGMVTIAITTRNTNSSNTNNKKWRDGIIVAIMVKEVDTTAEEALVGLIGGNKTDAIKERYRTDLSTEEYNQDRKTSHSTMKSIMFGRHHRTKNRRWSLYCTILYEYYTMLRLQIQLDKLIMLVSHPWLDLAGNERSSVTQTWRKIPEVARVTEQQRHVPSEVGIWKAQREREQTAEISGFASTAPIVGVSIPSQAHPLRQMDGVRQSRSGALARRPSVRWAALFCHSRPPRHPREFPPLAAAIRRKKGKRAGRLGTVQYNTTQSSRVGATPSEGKDETTRATSTKTTLHQQRDEPSSSKSSNKNDTQKRRARRRRRRRRRGQQQRLRGPGTHIHTRARTYTYTHSERLTPCTNRETERVEGRHRLQAHPWLSVVPL